MGKENQPIRFYPKVLSALQKTVLRRLGPILTQRQFYLVGGTALAIYFGHRHSADLDWFTKEFIGNPMRLAQEVRDDGIPFKMGSIERGTLHGTMSGIRFSLLEYRYPLLKPLVFWTGFRCSIASMEDIACMKLSAIAQRGSKKDFVDIYALGLKHIPLREMLRLYQEKYGIRDIGHVLYSLAYSDDADKERMPKLLWDIDWKTIKKTLRDWVKQVARSGKPNTH